jgi:DMSO reductase anchor subunit
MHPAYSVIFFTTASGAGYGALIWLAGLAAGGALPADRESGIALFLAALGLVTAGLLSSTFHLGHPERAWRGLTQWRSSWLSREGVAAVVAYLPALLFAAGWIILADNSGVWIWAGIVAAVLAVVTVACTGMIYASLRAIPRWTDPFVVPVYLAFAVSSGGVLVLAIAALFGTDPGLAAWVAAISVALAWILKLVYWRRIDRAKPVATAESATGLGSIGTVRLLESPNSSANFVMREMGYVVARKHAARLRLIAAVLGGVAPVLALAAGSLIAGYAAAAALLVALAGIVVGVLIERWLFFAEAQHAAMLYYGARTV